MGIKEIAKKADVSIATVSRVLNNSELVKDETKKKILAIAKDTGYKKYNSGYDIRDTIEEIGVIIPNTKNLFFSRILQGISTQSIKLDLPITLYLTNDNTKLELYAIEKLASKKVKGIIIIRVKNKESVSTRNIQKLKKYSIPVVLVDRDIRSKDYSGVFLSNAGASYDAMSKIIKLGYKKIAIIAGPCNNLNSEQRLDGYKKALIDNNLPINENLIYHSEFSAKDGYEITNKIINSGLTPEILFSCSNRISLGCLKAFKKNQQVYAGNIKLFSFNELEHSGVEPFNVSYINHPVELMGIKSMSILKSKLIGTRGQIREILNYKIQIDKDW